MSLPPPDIAREPLHTRNICVRSFAREDGQWDLEAELIDTKAYDFPKANGDVFLAGQAIHHMHLRVTIDADFTITAAVAAYDAAPYNAACTAIAPAYEGMVGMNLLRNFRQVVKKHFARTAGCTHLTELSYVLPTVAVQSMAGRRRQQAALGEQRQRPFQLDGCHALSTSGEVVKTFFPQWYAASAHEGAKCD